jgi:hypothetical protein
VPLNSQCDYGSGGPDDHARNDQLKLNAPVKQNGPVDLCESPAQRRGVQLAEPV